jgi:hypothetical protein
MTPGQLLLRFYHTPVSRIRDSLRNGGPWQERRTERGRVAMEAAALTLPVPAAASGPPLPLHLPRAGGSGTRRRFASGPSPGTRNDRWHP